MEINKLIRLEKHCEETFKCLNCGSDQLVGCDYQEILLMCANCGYFYGYNEKEDKIYDLSDEELENEEKKDK